MNLQQSHTQSAKEFSDVIKDKLRELSEIIKTLYQNEEVIKSFRTEYDKIACRAFKEGLRPPLKHRIVNFEPKTLDELIKKAVEEEPYVAVLKSSIEGEHSNSQRINSNDTATENKGNDNRNINQDTFQRPFDERRNYQRGRNFRGSYRPSTPFPRRNRNSNFNRNYDLNNNNSYYRTRNSENFFNQRDSVQGRFCVRCNRNGHTVDTCYVRLESGKVNEPPRVDNLTEQVKRVSLLEAPQPRRTDFIPNKVVWSNRIRK